MAFRTFANQDEVAAYVAGLDERWPQRLPVMQHISDQLRYLRPPVAHVVELCSGPGKLANVILAQYPDYTYTGLDISADLLDYARTQLGVQPRIRLIQTDLNADGWPDYVDLPVHAVVAMQSLHDLGDEAKVERIYRMSRELLTSGGVFISADLLAHTVEDPATNPGRLSPARHIELLRKCGYERVACTLQLGDFGCFVGCVP